MKRSKRHDNYTFGTKLDPILEGGENATKDINTVSVDKLKYEC